MGKRYIPVPVNYSFEKSLGNGLYLFEESVYHRKSYSEYKSLLTDINGKIILDNINGFAYFNNNHLIISNDEGLMIIGVEEGAATSVKIIKKDDKVLAKPGYNDENILIVEKNCVKLLDVYLNEVKKINVDGLDKVLDSEWEGEVLKILVPFEENGKQINKHLFINLNNDKVIYHVRIDGYPYWVPTTFIGRDAAREDNTEYYFYNKDFEFITKIKAEAYQDIDDERSDLFFI